MYFKKDKIHTTNKPTGFVYSTFPCGINPGHDKHGLRSKSTI